MADRASLEFLGFILGGVTALVILTATIVVRNNLNAKGVHDTVAPITLTPLR
jgi:hypothetical protein